MNARTITSLLVIVIMACNRNQNKFDASGTFEADEVIVSASASGKILPWISMKGPHLQKIA